MGEGVFGMNEVGVLVAAGGNVNVTANGSSVLVGVFGLLSGALVATIPGYGEENCGGHIGLAGILVHWTKGILSICPTVKTDVNPMPLASAIALGRTHSHVQYMKGSHLIGHDVLPLLAVVQKGEWYPQADLVEKMSVPVYLLK